MGTPIDRRQSYRTEAALPVKCRRPSYPNGRMNRTTDISEGGIGLRLPEQLDTATPLVDLEIYLSEGEEPFRAKGEVVWQGTDLRIAPDSSSIGIRFIHVVPVDQRRLTHFLATPSSNSSRHDLILDANTSLRTARSGHANFLLPVLRSSLLVRAKIRVLIYKKLLQPLLFTSRLGRKMVLGHIRRWSFVDYIYVDQASGYTWLGKFVDRALFMLPVTAATKSKMHRIKSLLEAEVIRNSRANRVTRIVTLGSDSLRYLIELATERTLTREQLQVVSLNNDKASLRIGRRISKGLPFEYRLGNAARLDPYSRLSNSTGWKPNLAIISGCYEFLNSATVRKSLEEIYHSLDRGGVVIVVTQLSNPNGKLLRNVRLPGHITRAGFHHREPFIYKKWMQESGYKEISVEADRWGAYGFCVGRKTGERAVDSTIEVPVFRKGRMYRRVINMRSHNAYQYMRGFKPLSNGRALRGRQEVILMASNDYLGLRAHPRLIQAAIEATRKFGVSTTSSRILVGNIELHEELQSKLATFLGFEDTLVFSSGYGTNVGVLAAILGRDEVALVDRLAHASMLDGLKLSSGSARFFAHNNVDNLRKLLEEHKAVLGKVIMCDGVYSMDGDLAPIPALFELAGQYGAGVIVDDGHATGIFGKTGRGTLEHFGIDNKENCLLLGSLSKAIGSVGGFVAGGREVIDYLRHTARSLLFSTGLPAANTAAALVALDIIREEPQRLQRLWENTRRMRSGLKDLGYDLGTSVSPIIPVVIGDEYTVYKMSVALEEAGVIVDGVAPPAVKQSQCRLRMCMMATHADDDITRVLGLFRRLGKRYKVLIRG